MAFAKIDAASSGDNTLVTGVAGYKIRVVGYTLVAAGTTTVAFQSGAGGTALTGAMPLVANTGVSAATGAPEGEGGSNNGLFETASGALLNLRLSQAIQVSGHLSYVLVAA